MKGFWPQSHRDSEQFKKPGTPLGLLAALAAVEFRRGFSTHGKLGFLFLVASATIEFSRRDATRNLLSRSPVLKRRAKVSRRYAANQSHFFKSVMTSEAELTIRNDV